MTEGARLILDDGDALPVVLRQDVVQQRRLAGAQEAGDHLRRQKWLVQQQETQVVLLQICAGLREALNPRVFT